MQSCLKRINCDGLASDCLNKFVNVDCILSYFIIGLRSQQFAQLRVTQRIATNEFTDIFTVLNDA